MAKSSTKARKKSSETGNGFALLGLDDRLVEILGTLGYEEPTPIQREAIPPLLEGSDLVGQADTGTGKTAAFALPILQRLAELGDDRPRPSALVLVPTRELAMQVAEAVHRYGRPLDVHVLPIYGGQSYSVQLRALKRGVDVVVATPGRALDHIRRNTLVLDAISVVVLDEADEMLDMGFADDLEAILAETPKERQTVLVSATLPPRIASIAKRHLVEPVHIKIAKEHVPQGEMPRIRQTAYVVQRAYKPAALGRVLDLENPAAALVFCRTRTQVDELTETLTARGYRAEALHGGMTQEQRTRVMKKLRSGAADLVIATDVAARGLDIEQLSHVINYDVPADADSYVHRIGRVGRAGRLGAALTLAEPREHRLLRDFERATKQKIEIAQVPTVADLRARRLDMTRSMLRETLLAGGLDEFRVVVESLADEFDPIDIALAAIKLAHETAGAEMDELEDIPEPTTYREKDRGRGPGPKRSARETKHVRPGVTRLYIGVGRESGVRPQDLVGAIAGETSLSGRDIGSISIAQRFSLVDVPEEVAGKVIRALRGTTIKGKKARVREDREA
jgi:ATP-dependent RNA helicase DeaD